jgi:hypothetical protein
VPANPNQFLFSLWGMKVSASGAVSFVLAASVSVLILAVAWRLVS